MLLVVSYLEMLAMSRITYLIINVLNFLLYLVGPPDNPVDGRPNFPYPLANPQHIYCLKLDQKELQYNRQLYQFVMIQIDHLNRHLVKVWVNDKCTLQNAKTVRDPDNLGKEMSKFYIPLKSSWLGYLNVDSPHEIPQPPKR